MKMIVLPHDIYALSLASCDFEELCITIERRLRQQRCRDPGVQIARCDANLVAGRLRLPSEAELWSRAKGLLLTIDGELSGLTRDADTHRLWN